MKEFLSMAEVCVYLNVSKSYVYKLSFNNVLPKYCPGGKLIWFKRSDVDDWLESSRISSQDEICAETELALIEIKNEKKRK